MKKFNKTILVSTVALLGLAPAATLAVSSASTANAAVQDEHKQPAKKAPAKDQKAPVNNKKAPATKAPVANKQAVPVNNK